MVSVLFPVEQSQLIIGGRELNDKQFQHNCIFQRIFGNSSKLASLPVPRTEELLPSKDFASLGEDLRPEVHVAVKLVNWTLAGGGGSSTVDSAG